MRSHEPAGFRLQGADEQVAAGDLVCHRPLCQWQDARTFCGRCRWWRHWAAASPVPIVRKAASVVHICDFLRVCEKALGIEVENLSRDQ